MHARVIFCGVGGLLETLAEVTLAFLPMGK